MQGLSSKVGHAMTRDEELVPLNQVLDDMYADRGPVSWAARDYYKTHYATPEQAKQMEREEKIDFIFASGFWVGLIVLVVISIIF